MNKQFEISKRTESAIKENVKKYWAKKLYRRAVKRCHPDVIRVNDKEYENQLITSYKNISDSFDKGIYDCLMVECYKLMLIPEEIEEDQIQILKLVLQF